MKTTKTLVMAGLLAVMPVASPAVAEELAYPGADFAKLDTFEGVNLGDADKLFAAGDYKGAYAAYKAYSFEFAKSKATAYVLLRMGRCLHKLEKRNAAIQAYQDVVDYFPNDTAYAAAALFHIGECHGLNGEEAKQTAVWARMVKDDGYVAQPNSGTALAFLAGEMTKLGKFDEAVAYAWRTAVAFRTSNPAAAVAARNAVIAHYVTRSPNHEKLKEFYIAAGGFEGRSSETDKPEDDVRYWSTVLQDILKMTGDAAKKESVCAYWSAKMGDRFVENDNLRKLWFGVLFVHEKDRAKWVARMDKQFSQKPADLNRVLQWCEDYSYDSKLRAEFFARHGQPLIAALELKEKMRLMERLRHLRMDDESQAVMRLVGSQVASDEEIRAYAFFAANYVGEDEVLRILARSKDPLFATKARFDYYQGRSHRNPPFMEKALAEIPALKQSPAYAGQELVWAEAVLLQGLGRYDDAIKAFRAANKQPASTWEIADCLVALKQYDQAVTTVREIESVGGATASAACLKAADIYRASGDKGREVNQLRTVLKRYPKSGESSQAHNRLESYGAALTGGESETEK